MERTGPISPPIAAAARRLVASRALRSHFFDDGLFGEPAWAMLLDLFVAETLGRTVSVSSLSLASNASKTTALRVQAALMSGGWIERRDDDRDRRRHFVSLTLRGRDAMVAYLGRICSAA